MESSDSMPPKHENLVDLKSKIADLKSKISDLKRRV